MERTSPKRIRIDAVVLEAQKVHEQLILAEGLAERAQVSVKEAADREKNECRRLAQRAEVSVKEAADREKIETLAAEDGKRAEKIDSKRAENEAARVKINVEEAQLKRMRVNEEAQLKRMRVNAECAMLCGAEGCGKGNQGQFESFIHASMRQHCDTQKHKVFDSTKCPFLLMFKTVFFFFDSAKCPLLLMFTTA